jgi:hypothetical protein
MKQGGNLQALGAALRDVSFVNPDPPVDQIQTVAKSHNNVSLLLP